MQKYKDDLELKEIIYYDSFNIKNVFLSTKKPILQINNTLFFSYNIGISKDLYQNNKNIVLEGIPLIRSSIPIFQIHEFLIKLIHKQYLHYNVICNESPIITILNKQLISITTNRGNFLVLPGECILQYDYEKIINKNRTDLKSNTKKGAKNELF
jgi:hypothetical protein